MGAVDHAEPHYWIHTIFMVYGAEAVVDEKRHLWDHEYPFCGYVALGGEESRINSQYKHANRLPRFGPQRCVIP